MSVCMDACTCVCIVLYWIGLDWIILICLVLDIYKLIISNYRYTYYVSSYIQSSTLHQPQTSGIPEGSQLSGWRDTNIAEDPTQMFVFTASNWRHWRPWGGLYLPHQPSLGGKMRPMLTSSPLRSLHKDWGKKFQDVSGCFSPLIVLPLLRAVLLSVTG